LDSNIYGVAYLVIKIPYGFRHVESLKIMFEPQILAIQIHFPSWKK